MISELAYGDVRPCTKLQDLHHKQIAPAMASTDQIQLRARFLQEGARLIAVSSPTAASFLGSARNRLIEDVELEIPSKEADAFRRSVCGACGNVLIPGWSCRVSNRTQEKAPTTKDKSSPKESTKQEKNSIYTCLRCLRETRHTLQPKPRRRTRKSRTLLDTKTVSTIDDPTKKLNEMAPKTVNASSKQRQKARKGGLQAMLEQKKKQSSSMGGFDLMDFAM
jgi:RNase P subunit RPR2